MRLFSLFVVFLAVAAWTAPVAAQPAGDPVPKILEAWKKRQTAFKTVKYEVSGTVKHFFVSPPRAGLEKVMKLPKAPFEIPYKAVLLLDCDTKRYRLWTEQAVWSPLSGVFLPSKSTNAYDGKQMFSSLNSENELLGGNRADVGVTSGSLSQHQVEASLWPLFAAHGIVPSAQRPLVPDKPPVNFNAEMFHHRGLVALEGVKCELIRTEPLDAAPAGTDELWVDPTANGFIRRHVYYAGKNPFIRLDTKPQLKAEAHIPKEWTCTWYEGARAKVIHRLEVDQFVGNLSVTDEDFQIALKPGMKVEERNIPTAGSGLNPAHPKIKKYTVTRSGETDFQETHQRRLDGTDVEPEGRPRWIWCVAGVVAVGAGVVIYLRWKRVRGGK